MPVDLDEVGEAISEQAGTENHLDLHTGTVWFHTITDFRVAEDLDLQRFIATIDNDDLAQRLSERSRVEQRSRDFAPS